MRPIMKPRVFSKKEVVKKHGYHYLRVGYQI